MGCEEILAFDNRLRSTHWIIWNYADPLTSLELLNYYLTLALESFYKNSVADLDPFYSRLSDPTR